MRPLMVGSWAGGSSPTVPVQNVRVLLHKLISVPITGLSPHPAYPGLGIHYTPYQTTPFTPFRPPCALSHWELGPEE